MRAARKLGRNTALQKVPFVDAVYRRLSRLAFGSSGTTVVTFRGIEIELPSGDVTTLPSLADGTYESDELDRFLSAVRAGDTVVDIGANVGIWSALLSARVGPTGRVVAFEPSPGNRELLTRNLARNGCTNVEVREAAVSDAPGTARLDTGSPGATHRLAGPGAVSGAGIEVPVVRLDDLARNESWDIAAIKIDIEGFEPMALAGMRDVLDRRPMLLTEFSMAQAAAADADWSATLRELMTRYGSCEVFDGRRSWIVGPDGLDTLLSSSKLLNLLFR